MSLYQYPGELVGPPRASLLCRLKMPVIIAIALIALLCDLHLIARFTLGY